MESNQTILLYVNCENVDIDCTASYSIFSRRNRKNLITEKNVQFVMLVFTSFFVLLH